LDADAGVAGAGALAGSVWAKAGATGKRINDAAAKGNQEGKNASFIFIILGIPSLLRLPDGKGTVRKDPTGNAGSRFEKLCLL
jgi:hypothetical protein